MSTTTALSIFGLLHRASTCHPRKSRGRPTSVALPLNARLSDVTAVTRLYANASNGDRLWIHLTDRLLGRRAGHPVI